MSDEKLAGIEDMDPVGVQNDGEPSAVVPVETPAEPKAEDPAPKTRAEEPKAEEPEAAPHKKTGSQRARERAEREAARAAALEQENAEMKAKLSAPVGVTDPTEPKLENFESLEAYTEALKAHVSWKAVTEAEARFKADQQRREFEGKQSQWKEADAKFSAKHPDWDDAIEDLQEAVSGLDPKSAPGFHALDAALSESDIAPALKYHLGKNPDELRRLAAMSPIKAVKELARIEDRLSQPPQEKPKPTSQAPPPIKPASGSPAPAYDSRFAGIEDF